MDFKMKTFLLIILIILELNISKCIVIIRQFLTMDDSEDYSMYMTKAGPGYIDPYRLYKY
jgi:hypothetical protein